MSDELAVAADQAMSEESVQDQPESFLDVDFGDEQVSFKDRDEAINYIKESGMRNRDYTQKTQTLAEQRREFERAQREHEKRVEEETRRIEELKKRYDRYEEAFRKRPQIARQLEQLVSRPASPDELFERTQGYADEKYKTLEEKLNALEAERERERLERQRDDIYARLGERYKDFDKEAVSQVLSGLEDGNLEQLLEMAFKASRYGAGPSEEVVAEKLKRKQGAKIAAGGGGPPPKSKGSTDPKDAYEEALEEYVGLEM